MADPEAVANTIRETHDEILDDVAACADRVATTWSSDHVTTRDAVVDPFTHELGAIGGHDRLLPILDTVEDAIDEPLAADPVPGPPYSIVTSQGPMLRASFQTIRIVVILAVFEIDRTPHPTYRRRDALTVEVTIQDPTKKQG